MFVVGNRQTPILKEYGQSPIVLLLGKDLEGLQPAWGPSNQDIMAGCGDIYRHQNAIPTATW